MSEHDELSSRPVFKPEPEPHPDATLLALWQERVSLWRAREPPIRMPTKEASPTRKWTRSHNGSGTKRTFWKTGS